MANVTGPDMQSTDPGADAVVVTTAPDNRLVAGIAGTSIWSGASLTFALAKTAADEQFVDDHYVSSYKGAFDALLNSPSDKVLKANILWALQSISAICNLEFVDAGSFAAADLKMVAVNGLKSSSNQALNGRGTFPGTDLHDGGQPGFEAYTFFDTKYASMTMAPEKGGSSNPLHTIIHEILHSLGLAHPHDRGNGSGTFSRADIGDGENVLDNDRYTIMSYERGGLDQNSQTREYGYAVTPMVLDIAAMQHLYGSSANHQGNTTYHLTDPKAAARDLDGSEGTVSIGRAFYAIWDTGGTDRIVYSGDQHVLINLNHATLNQSADPKTIAGIISDLKADDLFFDLLPGAAGRELRNDLLKMAYHAGGFFSRVFEDDGSAQLGGYSIANPKYSDADHKAGSGIENAKGGRNADILIGNDLDNTLKGHGGGDLIHASRGNDHVQAGPGADSVYGGAGRDQLSGGSQADVLRGGAHADKLSGGHGSDHLFGGHANDRLFGNAGGDHLNGGAGHDVIKGGLGQDRLIGGKGDDTLIGGKGCDIFVFSPSNGQQDLIEDFRPGQDLLSLKRFEFANKQAALNSFSEWGAADDAVVSFGAKGTDVIIKGADLADIGKADILI